MKIKDISGQKFGRLTAINCMGRKGHDRIWLCKCECGNTREVKQSNLTSGHTKSCGCLRVETTIQNHLTHGKTNTPIYNTYLSIKARCYNYNHTAYKNYGGRGITMCDEWKYNFQAFYKWAINNGYKEGLQIDRIDNNGNYEPSNCHFTTAKENSNNRRSNRYITIGNVTHTLSEWCNIYDIKYSKVYLRLRRGWDIKKSLEIDS